MAHRRVNLGMLAIAVGVGSSSFGQSFNIDIDTASSGVTGNGVPSSAFAAAGLPGVWNSLTGTSMGLVRLDGVASSATATRSTTSTISGFNNTNTTGDAEKLMDDYQRFDAVPFTVTISNLQAGHYRVLTYANRVNGSGNRSSVAVAGGVSTNPQLIGGALSLNTFTRGVTHAEHVVALSTTGSINITLDNSPPAGTGALNGIQLIQSSPSRLHVDASKPDGGDGLSWATAINDLQAAITLSGSLPTVTEVWVARGTYRPAPPGGSRTATFAPLKSIFGGFAGTETLRSQRSIALNPTILSGDLNANDTPNFGNRSDNVFHVVTAAGPQSGITVNGFHVQGGQADGPTASDQRGGGFNITSADQFRIDNCTIIDNKSAGPPTILTGGGGAISFVPPPASPPRQLTVCRSLIRGNASGNSGAALWMDAPTGSAAHFINCRVLTNTTDLEGTMSVQRGACHLANCLVAFNAAGRAPGVLFGPSASGSSVRNCTITQNFGPNPVAAMGLAHTSPAAVVVANSIITRQWAQNVPNQPTDIVSTGGLPTTLQIIRTAHANGGVFGGAGLYGVRFDDPIGPDLTPDTGDELFSLSPASVLVDQGSNTEAPPDTADLDSDGNTTEPIPFDLDGNPRFQNVAGAPDLNGQANPIDPGAFERAGTLQEWGAPLGGSWQTGASWFPAGIPGSATTALIRFTDTNLQSVVVGAPSIAGRLIFDGFSRDWDFVVNAPLTLGPTVGPAAHFIGGSDYVVVSGDSVVQVQGHARVGDSTIGVAGDGPTLILTGPGDAVRCDSMSIDGAGEVYLSDSSTLSAPGGVLVNNRCTLGGTGNVVGSLECRGTVSPGQGLMVNGDLMFSRAWMPWASEPGMFVSLEDPGGVGRMNVTGTANLAGTLNFFQGYALPDLPPIPPVGTEWTLISMGSRVGTFPTAFLPGDADKVVRLIYQDSARSSALIAQVDARTNVQSLNPPQGFAVPGSPAAAAVGDLDGDGFSELAVVVPDPVNPTGANGKLKILFNLGATGTSWNGYAAVISEYSTQFNPSSLSVADFDGDNRLDIAVTNRSGTGGANGTVSVFRNLGGGALAGQISITTQIGAAPSAIGAGDITGDGRPDLVASNSGDGSLTILQNTSAGIAISFTAALPSPTEVGLNPVALFVADLDADGDIDIGTANRGSGDVSLLFNQGTVIAREGSGERAWAGVAPVRHIRVESEPSSIQPGNIDNGKETEIVVTNAGSGSVSVLLRGPNGEYSSSSGPIGGAPSSVTLIDIDNDPDDRLDVLAVTQDGGTSQVAVLQTELGPNGEILLTNSPEITPPDPPSLILADDVNGDGTTDLIAVNPDTVALREPDTGEALGTRGAPQTIKVQLNYKPCPADLNYDRVVNVADLTFFLGRFGQTATPGSLAFRADFNKDGVVNTRDLTFFLNRFGIACP